jgi:hypothetical protein
MAVLSGRVRIPCATPPPITAPATPNITSANGSNLGALVDTKLCGGGTLHVPELGVEGKLLSFIQDPAHKPDKTSWFDFDRLLFDTDSASLQSQSTEQLNNIFPLSVPRRFADIPRNPRVAVVSSAHGSTVVHLLLDQPDGQ